MSAGLISKAAIIFSCLWIFFGCMDFILKSLGPALCHKFGEMTEFTNSLLNFGHQDNTICSTRG